MNIKEFENNLILLGSDISKWQDKGLMKEAQEYLEKTKSAQKIHKEYSRLDSKLKMINEIYPPADLDEKIMQHIDAEDNSEGNNIFLIFHPRFFVPVLSIILVFALSFVMYQESQPSEEEIYAYADQIMQEVRAEDEIKEIEEEAITYEEFIELI